MGGHKDSVFSKLRRGLCMNVPDVSDGNCYDFKSDEVPSYSYNQARRAPLDMVPDNMESQPMDTKIEGSNTEKMFNSEFTFREKIGKGTCAVMSLVTHNATGKTYACKEVLSNTLNKSNVTFLAREAKILSELNHPNIVKLMGWYEEPNTYYMLLEACLGGELFDRIAKKHQYTEKEAHAVLKQLLDAISYCHNIGIVHRDLKPENLLLVSKNDDINVKIANFGLAARVSSKLRLKNQCGTPGYEAPEIICKTEYGTPVDMWSLGVICYILLVGYPPFPLKTPKTYQMIKRGKIQFHPQYWKRVSLPAKDLILAMLTVDPAKRVTADDALKKHLWMSKPELPISKPYPLTQFHMFNARRKLMSCITTIIATQYLQRIVTQRNISDYYKLGNILGKGVFSEVKNAVSLKSGKNEEVAIKCCTKKTLRKRDIEGLDTKVRILLTINHPNILTLIDTFEDLDYYFIVVEKALGGELFDRIVQKVQYSEADAQVVIRTILTAVSYCHKKGIVHRDLKPENLLLKCKESDTELKIADFGFAAICCQNELLREQCGTPSYIAPEILKGCPYNQAVDVWSIGVIAFILLGGYPPFRSKDRKRLFFQIMNGLYTFSPCLWDGITDEAKDLIKKMLMVDPKKRITASEALKHPYMLRPRESFTADMENNFHSFKLFNAKRKLRSSILSYIVVHKVYNLLPELKTSADSNNGFKDEMAISK